MAGLIKLEYFFVRTSVCKSFGFLFGIVFCTVLFPVTSHAQVLLSEIAWMGTDADANNEWIEIYNFGTTPTDLTGWTLVSDDGSISITLSGTLSSHAVAVLERTDDTTLPGITALLTYVGALANGGTTLTLKDGNGAVSDQAIGGSNWEGVGGSNTAPKKTPQRTRAGTWITANPTPGSENAEVTDTATTTTDTHTTVETNTTSRKTSSGGGSASKISVPKIDSQIQNPVLTLAFDIPHTVYVHEKVNFEAEPSGVGTTIMDSLQYMWNFGDTYIGNGKKTEHAFTRPGEYVVVLQGMYAKHDAMVRHDVMVLPIVFEITRASNGDLVIHNKSPEEIDLGGFSLGFGRAFKFSRYTFVKAGGLLTVPRERIQGISGLISLLDTEGVVVAYEKATTPKPISNEYTTLTKPAPQALLSKEHSVSDFKKNDSTPEMMASVAEASQPSQETVIHIGSQNTEASEQGFIGRVLQKITSFFSF